MTRNKQKIVEVIITATFPVHVMTVFFSSVLDVKEPRAPWISSPSFINTDIQESTSYIPTDVSSDQSVLENKSNNSEILYKKYTMIPASSMH